MSVDGAWPLAGMLDCLSQKAQDRQKVLRQAERDAGHRLSQWDEGAPSVSLAQAEVVPVQLKACALMPWSESCTTRWPTEPASPENQGGPYRAKSGISPEMTSKLVDAYQSLQVQPGAATIAVETPDDELSKLSPREHEILACVAQGQSNKEIARALDIAETTVKIHVQHILRKLKLTSRVQAAVYAVERKI